MSAAAFCVQQLQVYFSSIKVTKVLSKHLKPSSKFESSSTLKQGLSIISLKIPSLYQRLILD